MSRRKRRSLLREVNEQIRNVTAGFAVQDSTLLLLCECERPDCLQRVEVPAAVYDELRNDSERFVVVSGHEGAGMERISAGPDGYAIVRAAWRGVRATPLPAI